MKLTGRQSKNVEIAPGKMAQDAPHGNPFTGAMGQLRAREKFDATITNLNDAGRAKRLGDKNPMAKALKGMDKPFKRDKNAAIPIPTERPDPKKPYKKPTVFTNEYKH